MNNLNIKGTRKHPTLYFDYEKGVLEIKGRSLPENSIEIYEPALTWLEEYKANPKPKTEVNVSLEYFNTSSSKVIIDIFRKLEEIHTSGSEVQVNWYFEDDDDDLKEEGETFKELMKVPLEMIPVKEFDFTF